MAAPTKEERKRRKEWALIVKRDNRLYTDFEKHCIESSKAIGFDGVMPFEMLYESELRTDEEFYQRSTWTNIRYGGYFPIEINCSYPFLDILPDLDDDSSLYQSSNDNIYNNKEMAKERVLDFALRHQHIFYKTREFYNMPLIQGPDRSKTSKIALVAIDFTSSLEDIIKFVSKIKNDFNHDPSSIQSLDEHLGIQQPRQIYKIPSKLNDIFISPKKPMEGRLADILFIYDCYRLGLSHTYARSEIDRYWNVVIHYFDEKINPATHKKFLKIAKLLIDDGEYHHILNQITIDPSK